MVRVRENFEVPRIVIDKLKKREFRPKQYTVTRLLGCPRRTYYKMCGIKEVIPEHKILTFARGRAHHSILEVFELKEVFTRVNSEVLRDGKPIPIIGDVDMIGQRITEIFTTTVSSDKIQIPSDALNVFNRKVQQLQAYCKFRSEYECDLLVFFLFGDYNRFTEVAGKKYYTGIRPLLRDFTFEFEINDLNEVWKLMNNNLAEIELARNTGIPPLTVGEKYECDDCGYEYLCFPEEEEKK